MFFTIDSELFSQDDVDLVNLTKTWTVCTEQHTFYQSKFDDVTATEESAWYKSLSDIDKKLWEESVARSLIMGDKYDIVKVSIGATHSAFEAYQYLTSPVKIVLENSRNDAHFLKAVFKGFRQEAKIISKHIENRWVQFAMGGGSSIVQALETEMESFNSALFEKENHEYLRCFVILDSDKRYPDEPLKQGTENIVAFLTAKNIPFHILEKREMENYIPEAAFEGVTKNRSFIDAYLRLTPEQKDYFDLEKGFPERNFDHLLPELKLLFETVSDEDKSIFRHSDLKRFTGSRDEDFKSECPKLFNSAHVTKATLMARTENQTTPDELKNIIQKIRELL